MKICAVIPAAGLGSRLGSPLPKILLPLTETDTVLSILCQKLFSLVDHIHIIASPTGAPLIRAQLADAIKNEMISISIQPKPNGMGDAIFQAYPFWSAAEKILIVWGDQVFVSNETLKRTVTTSFESEKFISLPLTHMTDPYVEYIFNANSTLIRIHQSREGDVCSEKGLADVGTFFLSVKDLLPAWKNYIAQSLEGKETGEINFLPFLLFLVRKGWQLKTVEVRDAIEARGINTPGDLAFFQTLYAGISQ